MMDLDFIDHEARVRYTERRQLDLDRCRDSLNRRDFTVLETVGHNLKGNGISFGFPELSQLGEILESYAKSGNFFESSRCLDQLQTWIESNK